MLELKGKHNTAKVFTDTIENEAVSQIVRLLNQEFSSDSTIRIMPDTHAGAGCTIGTTMTLHGKVVPYMVGVDIGCGMETIQLAASDVSLEELDQIIHEKVPSGFTIHDSPLTEDWYGLNTLLCRDSINMERALCSIGTLGGGNHFIELDQDDDGIYYLIIHSGSRYLGKQVADYYQDQAVRQRKHDTGVVQELITRLKAQGREREIQAQLKKMPTSNIIKELAWLDGSQYEAYLHDMEIVQNYAAVNRRTMARNILISAGIDHVMSFTTIHNYIDTKMSILRKGAISAQKGEQVLIPINMRDGSLLCTGKGNSDWNWSAPHGAGRLMSRSKAKETISLAEFQDAMEGIYSSTVGTSTIDEAPMAYKPMAEIMKNIRDTVTIDKVLKPVYNFKATDS